MKLFILIACWCLFFTIQAVQGPAPTAVDSKSEDYVITPIHRDSRVFRESDLTRIRPRL